MESSRPLASQRADRVGEAAGGEERRVIRRAQGGEVLLVEQALHLRPRRLLAQAAPRGVREDHHPGGDAPRLLLGERRVRGDDAHQVAAAVDDGAP
jgi:hypothetical protein